MGKFHGNALGVAVKGYYSSLWLEGYEVRVVYTLDFIPEGDNPNLAVG